MRHELQSRHIRSRLLLEYAKDVRLLIYRLRRILLSNLPRRETFGMTLVHRTWK